MSDEQEQGKPDDQAHGLRALVTKRAPAVPGPRVVAIASGKGGVGKTMVATNIAVLAARRGARVLLVDGDLALANVDVALGTRARFTVDDVIGGRVSAKEALATGPGGVKILAAGCGVRSLAHLDPESQRALLAQLAELDEEFDVVVIDCGAGIGENVQFLAAASTRCALVLTADPTSLMDAYSTAKVLAQLGVDEIDVVVNQSASEADARDTYGRLVTVVARFLPLRLRYAGSIPRDDSVRSALMARHAVVDLHPTGRATGALRRLERALLGDETISRPPGRVSLWWDRLFRDLQGGPAV